jgi:hypothetical protein
MTTTTSSAALVLAGPVFSDQERMALAGFLAGYSGMTREAYALDLRQFAAWCHRRQLRLFAVRRADIELFARELEIFRAGPAPRSPGGCPPSPGSTSTPSRKTCWSCWAAVRPAWPRRPGGWDYPRSSSRPGNNQHAISALP